MKKVQKKYIDLETRKRLQLQILKSVHKICEQNQLYYFLGGGTLIGAIRHKGYIPWDDDIDIMMPRKDYEKLVRILNRKSKHLNMVTYKDGGYYYAFGRISIRNTCAKERNRYQIEKLGVYIDVFPYDGISSDIRKTEKTYAIMGYLQKLRNGLIELSKEGEKYYLWKKVLVYILMNTMTLIAKRYKVGTTEKVACVVAVKCGIKEVVPADVFAKRILVPFEDFYCYVPVGYDLYLRQLYGDYMAVPSEAMQKEHHNILAWRR